DLLDEAECHPSDMPLRGLSVKGGGLQPLAVVASDLRQYDLAGSARADCSKREALGAAKAIALDENPLPGSLKRRQMRLIGDITLGTQPRRPLLHHLTGKLRHARGGRSL